MNESDNASEHKLWLKKLSRGLKMGFFFFVDELPGSRKVEQEVENEKMGEKGSLMSFDEFLGVCHDFGVKSVMALGYVGFSMSCRDGFSRFWGKSVDASRRHMAWKSAGTRTGRGWSMQLGIVGSCK